MLFSFEGVPLPGKVRSHKVAVVFGSTIGCISFLFLTAGLLFWWRQRHNRQIQFDIDGM
jgi:preprotein translocase subunit SecF